jgi:hypothetical protein
MPIIGVKLSLCDFKSIHGLCFLWHKVGRPEFLRLVIAYRPAGGFLRIAGDAFGQRTLSDMDIARLTLFDVNEKCDVVKFQQRPKAT